MQKESKTILAGRNCFNLRSNNITPMKVIYNQKEIPLLTMLLK